MSTIKIETARCSETFDGKIRGLSDGFRHVASVQLTPKLQDKVKTEENKQSLCDTICLSAVRFSAYETYKNGISSLPFRVVSLRYATWIAECCVIWKSKDKSKSKGFQYKKGGKQGFKSRNGSAKKYRKPVDETPVKIAFLGGLSAFTPFCQTKK